MRQAHVHQHGRLAGVLEEIDRQHYRLSAEMKANYLSLLKSRVASCLG